jgi:hypothetical protein
MGRARLHPDPAVSIFPSPLAKSLACAAALVLAGCEDLLTLDGNPELCRQTPSSEAVTNELAVVRVVENPGPNERLVLDRLRYQADDLNEFRALRSS